MANIERRIKALETQTGKGEPVTIHLHKRIIGLDGEVERTESRGIHLGAEGHGY